MEHHELSHLAHGHHRHLSLAAMVEHAFGSRGIIARSTAALRLAVEGVADEDAAESAACRHLLRSALLQRRRSARGQEHPPSRLSPPWRRSLDGSMRSAV